MTNGSLVLPCHPVLPNGDKENILEKQLLMDSDKWLPVGLEEASNFCLLHSFQFQRQSKLNNAILTSWLLC